MLLNISHMIMALSSLRGHSFSQRGHMTSCAGLVCHHSYMAERKQGRKISQNVCSALSISVPMAVPTKLPRKAIAESCRHTRLGAPFSNQSQVDFGKPVNVELT